MERTPVESSNIVSVGWNNGTLEIEFIKGKLYQYMGVPKEVYTNMLRAESVGKYFHANIRSKYSYIQL